jgi:hypothetical protein
MDDNSAAQAFLTQDEFNAILEASPRWKAIKEGLFARAYEDLRVGEFENGGGVLLTTVIGVRGQDTSSMRLTTINLLIKDKTDEPGIGSPENA